MEDTSHKDKSHRRPACPNLAPSGASSDY